MRSREIFVAAKAFLIDESWLKVGWDLWEGSDDIRQNFIVLPTDDMEDFTNLSAIPADRAALTREILSIAGLQVNESEHDIQIINAASRFWTEHFSRATLVSMARALHVPKSITDRMGWWSIGSEASEEYIRTYCSLIAKVQEKIATTMREAIKEKNREDVFGENYVLEDLEECLQAKDTGCSNSSIKKYINSLRTFNEIHALPNLDEATEVWNFKPSEVEERNEVNENPGEQVPEKDESSEEEEEQVKLTSIPGPGVWVISVSRQTKCLHIVGQCHRKPGVHYHKWTETKSGVKQEQFKKDCKVCFRLGYPLFSDEQLEQVDENLAEGMPEEVALEDGDSSTSE